MTQQKSPGYDALRKGRWSQPGMLYVITTVTRDRKPVFEDIFIGRMIVLEMKRLEEEGHLLSLAWVLMPDHLHWLFELCKEADLSHVVKLFKGRSAHNVNRQLKQRGRLWQRAFYDHALRKDEDIRKVARYIVANPLRAKLVEDIGVYSLWDAVWI